MNTFLTVALLAALLMLGWLIRTVSDRLIKAFGPADPAADQTGWRGNRVRSARHPVNKA